MDRLRNGKAWVSLTFSDGTKQTILTTLSREIMQASSVNPRENFLWDFSKNRYIPFRRDAVNVEIFDQKPVYEREVLNFASRFI